MRNKINFPALALCSFLSLGLFNCASNLPPAPKREKLESRLDVERKSNTYTLELRKGNMFIGINPIKSSADGIGGYIIKIYDKKGENEFIDMMFEIYEAPFEIFDEVIDKNRLASTNCYAGEIRIQIPDFYIKFNKKYDIKGKGKVFSEWWHVYGKIYDKDSTIMDIDGDGNPERIFYGDKEIELFGNKNLEKNKDIIASGMKLFFKAREYFYKNVGRNFEYIKF